MKLRMIILGSGSSMGVPRLGGDDGRGDWGACDPDNPKNRRSRCSVLVQACPDDQDFRGEVTNLLVDTSPDLREQLLRAQINRVDSVLITHDHADQTHGIDDLRVLAYRAEKRLPVYIDQVTAPHLIPRFEYCFVSSKKTGYPAILETVDMPADGDQFAIDGPGGSIPVRSFYQTHGPVQSLGFIFGEGAQSIAYSSDVNDLGEKAFDMVEGCNIWVLDALRRVKHPSHSHLDQSIEWINKVGARRGILTNLHIDLDYEAVRNETPDHIEPGYDGMVVEPEA